MQNDKAGHEYWDKNWDRNDYPAPFDPNIDELENTFYTRTHEYVTKLLAGRENLKILEIGCAHSMWPYYFQNYHGAQVDGLDYSEIGCKKTRQMWDHYGIKGDIHCADMFDPPKDLLGQYDMVVSFGVMEHFEDTSGALSAAKAFVKPGGQVFTMIPNLSGLLGVIQKCVDSDIYNIHVPLSSKDLLNAHKNAGFDVKSCQYFMGMNLNVVHSEKWVGTKKEKVLRRMLSIPTKLTWMLERPGLRVPANQFTSPYIIAVAEKNNAE